jgi:threonine dehydrogenase-like Zn-dependent dehydrogenase
VPADVPDEAALFVGDILTTAVYAASIADAAPSDVVAVVGAGPVGFLCIQALRAEGVETVIALDREPERLALAERVDAISVHVGQRNPQTSVDDLTSGRGADVVVDAVGHPAAFESAVSIARRGGRVVVVGMYAGETVEMQLGVYWARALDLRFAGLCPVHAYWERAMGLVASRAIDPMPLVSHRLPLEHAGHGYELFDRRQATKVLLVP